ncbi:hypothetical protein J2T60_001124 [Natronospira proteinivora]|uniref:DUF4382 domain-containing protein n=1 Tax=Natronospira proteinivora TaxID=1807133 RepID=A0ABT1G781_9GAMM|nr:DUF4382 domain-containing protein [Natronospira proteinivora]MCP1727159.1 hypothetical protein [Natronospira proteinivora]
MIKILYTTLSLTACLGLAACFDGAQNDTGLISVYVTDAPVDEAAAVYVTFTAVELQHENGDLERIELDEPRQIDLLRLQGTNSERLLRDASILAGEYEWLRLDILAEPGDMDSFVEMEDGGQHPLHLPEEYREGLKTSQGFEIAEQGILEFTVDFDLRKSLLKPNNAGDDYILRPELRLVDNDIVGTLQGRVRDDWANLDECTPAVYLYEGHEAETGSEGSENPPLTSALVSLNTSNGDYRYSFGFLPPGEYTAAFTCDAGWDNPIEDNDIEFLMSLDVEIEEDESTEAHFENDDDNGDD